MAANNSVVSKASVRQFEGFTVANAPQAADHRNAMIVVTDGAAGAIVSAVSDGTNWLRSDTMAPISAS